MTNEEWEELGRRAVACKHWRWMPGMTASGLTSDYQERVLSIEDDGLITAVENSYTGTADGNFWCTEEISGAIPDLRDPATLGCLLHLVREAWGAENYVLIDASLGFYDGDIPSVTIETIEQPSNEVFSGSLVAALEAAP